MRELLRAQTGETAGASAPLAVAQPSFKDLFSAQARIVTNAPVTGLFLCSTDGTVAEICAGAGFDYLLVDGEHSPFTLAQIQVTLRVIAAYPTLALVRVPANDEVLIKQYLDAGAQSILVPMVDSVEQAQVAARAVAYPPAGVRGVGSALARSARWNRIPRYLASARETISLVVQIESAQAVEYATDIAAVEGMDGLFVGPSDLAASMGLIGQQSHPDVVAAVKETIGAAKRAGKIVGVNAFDRTQAEEYVAAGADFVNVGADVALLARATEQLAGSWLNPRSGGKERTSY